MDSFINKVKSGLEKGVNTVSTKSKGMMEITKLNNQINSLKKQKDEAVAKMGHVVYGMFCEENLDVKKINEECLKIKDFDRQVASIREQIKNIEAEMQSAEIKFSGRTCKCGQSLSDDAKFCSSCGSKVEEIKAGHGDELKCECGAPIKKEYKFCGKCGRKIEMEE